MKKNKLTIQEQKSILDMQAQIIRLRLMSAQFQNKQQQKESSQTLHHLWKFFENIPLSNFALKLINRPKKWRNKLILGSLVSAWLFLSNR